MIYNTATAKIINNYKVALNNSDASAIAQLFAKNGLLMPQGAPATSQLKDAYLRLFTSFQLKVNYVIDDVMEDENFTIVQTHSTGSTKILNSEEEINVNNKEVFILKKENNQLKIYRYIFNNNTVAK